MAGVGGLLAQGAAEQHVQLLYAAADAEHGLAPLDHARGERQGHRVALGIVRGGAGAGGGAIALGRHVRARAGEEQAIEGGGHPGDVGGIGGGGDEQHGRLDQLGERADEAGGDDLHRAIHHFVAAEHADDGAGRRGVGNGGTEAHQSAVSTSTSRSVAPAARSSRRASGWTTTLSGGTSSSSQTLPPMVERAPMVTRPRMVAPA